MEIKNLVIEASVEYLMLFQNTSSQSSLENEVYLGGKILTILTEPSSRMGVRKFKLRYTYFTLCKNLFFMFRFSLIE